MKFYKTYYSLSEKSLITNYIYEDLISKLWKLLIRIVPMSRYYCIKHYNNKDTTFYCVFMTVYVYCGII